MPTRKRRVARPRRSPARKAAPKRRGRTIRRTRKNAVHRPGMTPEELESAPFISLDGNMSPETQAKVKRLVADRHGSAGYTISAHDGSEDDRVLRRRKRSASRYDSYGRGVYVIPGNKLAALVIAMARSGRDDEYSLASGILSTLNAELV